MVRFTWETDFRETLFGAIPKDWDEKKIGAIADVGGGTTPSTKVKDYWDGDVAWITPNDLASHVFRYISRGKRNITEKAVKENSLRIYPSRTVLLTSRAPIGYVAIARSPVTTNQGFKNIIPDEWTDSEFLYFLLKNIVEFLRDIAGGSTFSELTATTLREVKIPYPSSSEQSRIATILSWFDCLIENKKRQNKLLEKTALAIFKNRFVNFEPFGDGEFVDSALGKMPKSWEVGKLSEVCEIIMGQSPPSKYYNREGEGTPFIQGKGQFGTYTPNTDVFCSGTGKRAKPKDILLTVRAPIGELNFADSEYIIGRGLATLRSETWGFVYLYLLSNKELLKASERGTTFDAITKPELESFPVVKPPQDVLEKFKAVIEPLFSKILLNQKEIGVLSIVRDVILPLLVFGKLRVEEI